MSVHDSPGALGHGHPVPLEVALDFINTLELEAGEPVDHLSTADDAIDWLAERGLMHRLPEVIRDGGLDRIHEARAALRELVDAAAENRVPRQSALETANNLLRAREILELVLEGDAVSLGHRHVGDPIDDALARIVEPIAREVSGDQRDRLRICANDRCRWAFYDSSRTGVRRWCDMATCGNRAKAARHRARARSHVEPGDAPRD
jgi:predicted RNA-binding Zn ribbon-like protein